VAVRLFRSRLVREAGFRDRLARDFTAARAVVSPYVAEVVDGDPYADQAWMATAYVPGPSLADAVKERGPLSVSAMASLAGALAEALKAIHAAGVVHRDLKPSDVLLAEEGTRVVDFGISRPTGDGLTATGAAEPVGYFSPEVVTGAPVGPPSDVFSLGAVLVFAAAGQAPFGSGSMAAVLHRLVNGEPQLGRVPESLRPLIEPCLRKDPAARPTAVDLLAEISALGDLETF
jgi:serine/threonine protein kinase